MALNELGNFAARMMENHADVDLRNGGVKNGREFYRVPVEMVLFEKVERLFNQVLIMHLSKMATDT